MRGCCATYRCMGRAERAVDVLPQPWIVHRPHLHAMLSPSAHRGHEVPREGYATGTCTGLVRCQFMLPQAGSLHAVAIRAEPTAACLTAASSMTGPPVSKTAATSSMIEQRLCQQCAARRAWLGQPTDRAAYHAVVRRSANGLAHRPPTTILVRRQSWRAEGKAALARSGG